jgi:hypothetical protein
MALAGRRYDGSIPTRVRLGLRAGEMPRESVVEPVFHGQPRSPVLTVKEIRVKHWLSSSLTLAVLVFALSFPVAVPAAPPAPQPTPAAAPAREPHPEIRAAIGDLRQARERLDHAAHDFGGHRVAAMKSIDEALEQLQICMKYDER